MQPGGMRKIIRIAFRASQKSETRSLQMSHMNFEDLGRVANLLTHGRLAACCASLAVLTVPGLGCLPVAVRISKQECPLRSITPMADNL